MPIILLPTMPSQIAGSTAVFDCVIDDLPAVAGPLGSLETLRAALHEIAGPPTILDANELCWMTDHTPHESLPLESGGYRQVSPRTVCDRAPRLRPRPSCAMCRLSVWLLRVQLVIAVRHSARCWP